MSFRKVPERSRPSPLISVAALRQTAQILAPAYFPRTCIKKQAACKPSFCEGVLLPIANRCRSPRFRPSCLLRAARLRYSPMSLLHPNRPPASQVPHLDRLAPRAAIPGGSFEIFGSHLLPVTNDGPQLTHSSPQQLATPQLPSAAFGDTTAYFDLARPNRALLRVPEGAIASDLTLRTNGLASQRPPRQHRRPHGRRAPPRRQPRHRRRRQPLRHDLRPPRRARPRLHRPHRPRPPGPPLRPRPAQRHRARLRPRQLPLRQLPRRRHRLPHLARRRPHLHLRRRHGHRHRHRLRPRRQSLRRRPLRHHLQDRPLRLTQPRRGLRLRHARALRRRLPPRLPRRRHAPRQPRPAPAPTNPSTPSHPTATPASSTRASAARRASRSTPTATSTSPPACAAAAASSASHPTPPPPSSSSPATTSSASASSTTAAPPSPPTARSSTSTSAFRAGRWYESMAARAPFSRERDWAEVFVFARYLFAILQALDSMSSEMSAFCVLLRDILLDSISASVC